MSPSKASKDVTRVTRTPPASTALQSPEKPVQRPLGTLLASARRITSKQLKTSTRKSSGEDSTWQADAWEMFDLVGELHFTINTISAQLGKARLYVGQLNPGNVTDSPDEVSDPRLVKALESLGGNVAGRQQILEKLGQQLGVAGEGWLIGVSRALLNSLADSEGTSGSPSLEGFQDQPDQTDPLDMSWVVRSVEEVTFAQEGTITFTVPELENPLTMLADDLSVIRVWRPHPRKWERADAPTKAALPVLQELAGLTALVSAQTTSRLAGAGLLLVPVSAKTHMQQAAGRDINDGGEDDEFTEALLEAMVTPINDRGSASAVVPMIATVPDESVDKFRHISFATPLDAEARELRDEAIRRFALGQQAPPELLLGTAGMNHWGGWLVQEETVSTHITPDLALICDALTTQFLWPLLTTEAYGMTLEDAQQYVIWYDVNHMIVRPNASSDAFELHSRGVITDQALLDALGYEEQVGVTKAELDPAVTMALDLARNAPSLVQNPGLPVLVEQIRALFVEAPGAAPVMDEELPTPGLDGETPERGGGGKLPETSGDEADLGDGGEVG